MSFNQRSTKLITVSCVDDAKYFHTHVEFFIKKQQENNKHFLPTRAISTVVELLLHYPILSLKSCTHYKSLQMFIFSHVVRYESVKGQGQTPLWFIARNMLQQQCFHPRQRLCYYVLLKVLLNVQTNIRVIQKLTHYSTHTVLATHTRFI